jgi:hypothetical protein
MGELEPLEDYLARQYMLLILQDNAKERDTLAIQMV